MNEFLICASPVGDLLLVSNGAALSHCLFASEERSSPPSDWRDGTDSPLLGEAVRQLQGYFDREIREFSLPLAPSGTAFQLEVWAALRQIPYGETISYGELARRIGRPKASRAVGLANGQNPLSVLIPCHRVIGASGALVGYGGGLGRKKLLLDLEQPRDQNPKAPLLLFA